MKPLALRAQVVLGIEADWGKPNKSDLKGLKPWNDANF